MPNTKELFIFTMEYYHFNKKPQFQTVGFLRGELWPAAEYNKTMPDRIQILSSFYSYD